MEKFTNEELLETLPVELRETKELTTKQKVVLGQLMIYNGLDKKDDEGYFFRSNLELASDCDIQEKHPPASPSFSRSFESDCHGNRFTLFGTGPV